VGFGIAGGLEKEASESSGGAGRPLLRCAVRGTETALTEETLGGRESGASEKSHDFEDAFDLFDEKTDGGLRTDPRGTLGAFGPSSLSECRIGRRGAPTTRSPRNPPPSSSLAGSVLLLGATMAVATIGVSASMGTA